MLNPWVILGIVLAWIASLAAVGYWQNEAGHTAERVEWQARDNTALTAANASIKRLNDEARSKERAHVDAMAALAVQLAKERASNDARRKADAAAILAGALRLRIPAPACGSGGGQGGATGAPASRGDGPATVELPQQITSDLFDLANDADQITDQLRFCQAVILSDRKEIP